MHYDVFSVKEIEYVTVEDWYLYAVWTKNPKINLSTMEQQTNGRTD